MVSRVKTYYTPTILCDNNVQSTLESINNSTDKSRRIQMVPRNMKNNIDTILSDSLKYIRFAFLTCF